MASNCLAVSARPVRTYIRNNLIGKREINMENEQPPKTSEAMGVHIVYISKAISEIKSTLKEIQLDAVGRVEFNEHVIWGQGVVKDHETRIQKLEDDQLLCDNSFSSKVKKALTDKAVTIIVILIIVIFLIALSKIGQNNLLDFI